MSAEEYVWDRSQHVIELVWGSPARNILSKPVKPNPKSVKRRLVATTSRSGVGNVDESRSSTDPQVCGKSKVLGSDLSASF